MDMAEDYNAMADALRASHKSRRRQQSGSAKGRSALERGRLGSRTLLDKVQLNVEISEELKRWLTAAKRDYRMTQIEIVERGLELVREELEKAGASRDRA
jgi:hypothetical protein